MSVNHFQNGQKFSTYAFSRYAHAVFSRNSIITCIWTLCQHFVYGRLTYPMTFRQWHILQCHLITRK